MKRKIGIISLLFLLTFSLVCGLTACLIEETEQSSRETKYSVSYLSGGAVGELPTSESYKEGETLTLPACSLLYEGYIFAGWSDGAQIYLPNDAYVIKKADVTFTATWEKIQVFANERYSYDRSVGEDMEIPANLYGANLYSLKIDDQIVASLNYSYDIESECIVIKQDYISTLSKGEHTLIVITDEESISSASCKIDVITTIETSFDSVTTKNFEFGKDLGVSFNVNFQTATVSSLKVGEKIVEEKYYSLENDVFTVKSEYLNKLYKNVDFTLTLSNHDSYNFTISSNVIFYSDYDDTTIHSDVESNIGHNPLYQYTDNVSIVSAESGLEGNALKFTPNKEDVLYGCDNVYTLKNPTLTDWMWYDIGYAVDKNYCISFDYMPIETTVGEFYFHNIDNTVKENLKFGEENNGKVFHFSTYLTGSQIGAGTAVYALFKNGGGHILFDNFRVVEVDNIPSIIIDKEYTLGSNEDFVISADMLGYVYEVYLNGLPISGIYNEESKTITLSASQLLTLSVGKNTLQIITPIQVYELSITAVNAAIAELTVLSGSYVDGATESVKLNGNIDEGVSVVSIKQKVKVTSGGYGDRNYYTSNLDLNFATAENFTLVAGLDGEGYLELSKAFLSKFYGVTEFEIEFSNGMKQTFSISSNNQMVSDYDVSTIFAPWGDSSSPLSSGFAGEFEIKEREVGNNALYILSSSGPATTYFTIRQHDHPWAWYTITIGERQYMRVVFDYQMSGLGTNSSFARMIFSSVEMFDKVQGSSHVLETTQGFNEIRWYLIDDGALHTVDTGWVPYDGDAGLFSIYVTPFDKAEGKYLMIDNFKLTTADLPVATVSSYDKSVGGDHTITLADYAFVSVKSGDSAINATFANGIIMISQEEMAKLSDGENLLIIETNVGSFKHTLTVINKVAELTVLSGAYVDGVTESVKLSGNISEGVSVVSIKQKVKVTSGGYGDRNYYASNLDLNFATAENFTLVAGLDGEGYLELSKAFLSKFYGVTEFEIEFSNGMKQTFSISSNNQMVSDYDVSTIFAPWGDTSSPLSSGFAGEFEIKEREPDNNALYIYSSGGPGTQYLTIRQHDHPWAWYTITMGEQQYMRVVFDYQMSGIAENSVFAGVIFSSGAMLENMQGNSHVYDTSRFDEARWYFIGDGKVHTIDTGWIPYDGDAGLFSIYISPFDKADGKYIMIDNFKLTTADLPIVTASSYDKSVGGDHTIELADYAFVSVKSGDSAINATFANGIIMISQEEMAKLSDGENLLIIETNVGVFKHKVSVVGGV